MRVNVSEEPSLYSSHSTRACTHACHHCQVLLTCPGTIAVCCCCGVLDPALRSAAFQRGALDVFVLRGLVDVGPLAYLNIGHDGSGSHPGSVLCAALACLPVSYWQCSALVLCAYAWPCWQAQQVTAAAWEGALICFCITSLASERT